MEVASLPTAAATADHNDVNGMTSPRTKRLLQGRALPAILVDNHPTAASRFQNSFRPHQRHPSIKKTRKDGGDKRSTDGTTAAPTPQGGPVGVSVGGSGMRRDGASTPCDSGVSFSSPDGDPPHHHHHHHPSLTSKSSVKSGAKTSTSVSGAAAASSADTRRRKKKPRPTPTPAPPPASGGAGGRGTSMSSGVSSGGRTSVQLPRQSQQKLSRLSQHGRATQMEGPDYSANPDPVPFMPSNFMSSTMLKKIPIPKRHQDTFGGYEYNFTGQRGVMLHTDRYQFPEALKALEGLNQRDRLLAEMAYLEHLRGIKRRREVVPHRAELDLFLGGKKIECEERFDLNREIQRLKAMAMPIRARDLYHGRGIHLPPSHHTLVPFHPRGPDDPESDEEDAARVSAPASMQRPHAFALDLGSPSFERQISLTLGDLPHTRSVIRGKRFNQLPSLAKQPTPRPGVQRDETNASRISSIPQPSNRSAAWGEDQNHILSRHAKKQPPQSEEERTFLTGQAQQRVPLPPPSAADKSRTPEAPPPTTEGGARRRSPQKLPTPNPLRGGFDLGVSEDVVSNLRQTFQRLDTDMDGHLQYHQLKSQLPAEFSQQQEDFVRQVYELTSSGAFFGVDEFMMMTQLTNRVAALSGPALEAYGKIDFKTLEAAIIRYVDLFQESDSSQKGRITMDSLRELVGKSQNKPALEESSSEWNTILDSLRPEYQSEVSRTEYLAHIPLLMSLAPLPQEDLNPQQPEEQLQGEK